MKAYIITLLSIRPGFIQKIIYLIITTNQAMSLILTVDFKHNKTEKSTKQNTNIKRKTDRTYLGKIDIDITGLYHEEEKKYYYCLCNSDNSSKHFSTCYIQYVHNSHPTATPAPPAGTL
jgi:hypothetical protein